MGSRCRRMCPGRMRRFGSRGTPVGKRRRFASSRHANDIWTKAMSFVKAPEISDDCCPESNGIKYGKKDLDVQTHLGAGQLCGYARPVAVRSNTHIDLARLLAI